jgi:hypothetical protein
MRRIKVIFILKGDKKENNEKAPKKKLNAAAEAAKKL